MFRDLDWCVRKPEIVVSEANDRVFLPQCIASKGGKCSFGGWQEGDKRDPKQTKGSISHCTALNKKLKDICKAESGNKLKEMKRIQAVDAEMLKRLREANNRAELEEKRKKSGRNKKALEEESDGEELPDDMSDWED